MARSRSGAAATGFGLSLGLGLFLLCLVVLIPLVVLAYQGCTVGRSAFVAAAASPRALAAYRLSFGAALAAALVNGLFGFIVAWVLARYHFPFKRLVDGLVDLPFALPTSVAGICLTAAYADSGRLGRLLAPMGLHVAFTPLGVLVAMIFVGLPFVVRTVQPVIEDLDREVEEAAASLGACRRQAFLRVLLPVLAPATLTGSAMALSRALGEYGSVVFISGNMPMRTEIAPLLIMSRLEQFDYAGANALAVVLLGASFALLLLVSVLQRWAASRAGW